MLCIGSNSVTVAVSTIVSSGNLIYTGGSSVGRNFGNKIAGLASTSDLGSIRECVGDTANSSLQMVEIWGTQPTASHN